MSNVIKTKRHICALLFISLMGIFTPGFAATMDAKAEKIANKVVEALGGRDNYNATRYIAWVFAGKNFHVWDKFTGDIRIENQQGELVLMNVNTKLGQAWDNGVKIIDAAVLSKKLDWAYKAWINDSYWLVMPYKLHDDGVNLTYTREDKTATGKLADVLTMTFEAVGVTPNNKYELFIEKDNHMLTQWRFYPTVGDEKPMFELPWNNWQYYGDIMLSDNRDKLTLNPINVYKVLPDSVMASPSPTEGIPGAILRN